MKVLLIAAATVLPATVAMAGDDCHVPPRAWQPRGAARQAAAGFGWRVDKIEADDGCWEVKARDAQGRRIKAKLDPATLQVVKLRHRDGGHDHKRDRSNAPAAAPSVPLANPLFQNGAPPVTRVK